ncbi:MAG: DUF86 domain-containing protein [Desulfomonilaceae bacterium]
MRDDTERLRDILESLESIQKYASKGMEAFFDDELIQVWIVHHIQVIREAASHVSATTREKYSQVPWPDIIAMRNILVHQYFGVDLQEIWETVIVDIPVLKRQIESILGEMD